MKTAREVIVNVEDPADKWETRHQYEIGKTQKIILDALGVEANNSGHASNIFAALGIEVSSKRQGRQSVPVVSKVDSSGGGINTQGDGEAWDYEVEVDLTAIEEWMG
jgi:hypothetical protein